VVNLSSSLNQTVTYWAPQAFGLEGGRVFAAPAALKARWEDKSEQVMDPKGEVFVSRARVYTLDVLENDGYLYLGTTNEADPRTLDKAYEVKATRSVPNLRSAQQMNVAML
jgi:hypothetical protein